MEREWEKIYADLRRRFAASAVDQVATAAALVRSLEIGDGGPRLGDLRTVLHKLAGSAGSYGYDEISRLSLDGELVCKSMIESGRTVDADVLERLRTVLAALESEVATPALPERAR